MRSFTLNLVLAVLWCLLWGSGAAWTFVAGLVIGALVVAGFQRAAGRDAYLARIARLVGFAWSFVVVLTKSCVRVAIEIVTPRNTMSPAILRYPVEGLSEAHKLALSNAITLTPGTLTLDISPDGRWLYVHCMYASSREAAVRELDELAGDLARGVFA